MDATDKLEWSALEYEDKEKSKDWFWALGIIVITGSLASAMFGNYFFAALLVLGGGMLGFFATKKPETISYEMNMRGLKMNNQLYPYESIQSFWVTLEKKPTLLIKSGRVFMPIISIPIEEAHADDIRSIMLSREIPEEEMREHLSEKIMESLGF